MKIGIWIISHFILTIVFFLPPGVVKASSTTLTMGWENWPPYQYQTNNTLTGLDIELIKAIVEHMGYKISFKERPWKRLL